MEKLTMIHQGLLQIVDDIDRFCHNHEITYYLMGGSALGAMRHKGFIPWDDDIDLFMTYDNYKRFLALFGDEAQNENSIYHKYHLERENSSEWPLYLSRVCLKNTTLISKEFKNNFKMHHNLFVDIMCLYSVPDFFLLQIKQYICAQFLRVRALKDVGFKNTTIVKRVMLHISPLFVNALTKRFLLSELTKYEGRPTRYVGHFFGRARFKKAIFPRYFIGKGRSSSFESLNLPVFECVEEYLTLRYGEKWMENPNSQVRSKYKTHSDFVDLNSDYSTYIEDGEKKWKKVVEVEIG